MGKEFGAAAEGTRQIVFRARRRPAGPLPQNRQWADFLRSLSAAPRPPDPLLPRAMKFHPRLHMDIRREEDRLALLQAQCLRLCAGDEARSRRLAADVIWTGPPVDR